jgi:hypothetical protein
MTIYVMHREVCLKHRKNRREIFLRVRTQVPSWQRCLFFFVVCGAGVKTRAAHSRSSSKSKIPERHSGDAGASPADRSTFKYTTRRAPACAARSPKPCGLGAAPRRRATFKLRGRQEARQRPHKPSRAGSIPAPATTFPGPLDHSGGHPPRKWESTVQSRGGPPFQNRGKVENHRSLISFFIVVRLHVPQPSRVGSRVKIASRL